MLQGESRAFEKRGDAPLYSPGLFKGEEVVVAVERDVVR